MLRAFSSAIQLQTALNRVNLMSKRKLTLEAIQGDPQSSAKKTKSMKAEATATRPAKYAGRTESMWKIGAHVSAAGGIENAITNAASIGANAFALFVKSQKKWSSPPLTDFNITSFKAKLVEHGYNPRYILPHGSYLINLGNPDAEKRRKSYDCFLDDLRRCESLGLVLYNFHPGSSVGQATTEESISLIAESINKAHCATNTIVTVLENMAGMKNTIGGDFNHLAGIIELVNDKTRVGVCLDTCHMFAAGYDLRTKEGWDKIVADFDQQVGLSYLRGMHLNDSKTEFNSKRDRHQNIGLGHIGMQGFHHILNDVRFQDIPLILETPHPEVWADEIAALYRLSGVDVEALEAVTASVNTVAKLHSEKAESRKTAKKSAKKGKKKAKDISDLDYSEA